MSAFSPLGVGQSATPPTLVTQRLVLRPIALEDFPSFAAFYGDEVRGRYRGGAVPPHDAYLSMAAAMGEWTLRGYGGLAISLRERESAVPLGDRPQAIGMTGLWHPSDLEEPELFWSLFAGSEGRGYATEAAAAVRDWAADACGLTQLMSLVHPDNTPSIKVAERLGATSEGQVPYRGEVRLRFRHSVGGTGIAGGAQ